MKEVSKQTIISYLENHKDYLNHKFGVTKIVLFGSYARDGADKNSDIDIAVELRRENKFRNFFALRRYLESIFQRKVDLGIESTLKPMIRRYIQKDIINV